MAYDRKFYELMKEGVCSNLTSAEQIVPYILELFPSTKSVVDFGCGAGVWLSAFSKCGISDFVGIDGDWVDESEILIEKSHLKKRDLGEKICLDRKYDMAISLEVAEHIEEKYADVFLDNLVCSSDLIVFSAAIPNQGGEHHVNEQWQSYWKRKFESRGYIAIDPIRGEFANNPMVMSYYAQNTLIYIRQDAVCNYSGIQKYIGIPFVTDIAFPYLTLDYTPKSWKFLARSLVRFSRIIWRKAFRIGEYKKKE